MNCSSKISPSIKDRFKFLIVLISLSFSSIGVDIAKAKGYDETLTNAEITGGGLVKLVSGRDTPILGGNVTGNKVELDVGRNLTVVSPQALGYRKGFTAGLTIGFGPTGISSIGIRGSKEKGDKAWTEPSSIVGVEGVDIRTEDTTRLVGALINATEGDVVLDTGRLELADLVIPPFLTGRFGRIYAACLSFCAGVIPPIPMFGRSLL